MSQRLTSGPSDKGWRPGLNFLSKIQNYKNFKVRSLMSRAWGFVEGDSWKGLQYARCEKSLSTGYVVRLRSFSRIPSTQIQDAVRCARCNIHNLSSAPDEGSKRKRQDVLWKSSFRDHTRWWDRGHQNKNSGWPDYQHKQPREVLLPNNCYKPSLVGAQQVTPDSRMGPSASAASRWSISFDDAEHLTFPGVGKRLTPKFVEELCQQGQVQRAVEVLEVLARVNSGVDKDLIYFVLKECVAKKDVMLGGQVHSLSVKLGFGSDTFLCNHFIRMYAGHGKLREAMDVFEGVAVPDAYMWSSIISAHAKQGQAKRAIELYQHLRALGIKPNGHVLVAAVQACAAAGDLESGVQMHEDLLTSGSRHDMFVCNSLVDMYAKCGSLKDARRVFDSLGEKTVVTWSAMIAGYARVEGKGQEALGLYSAMRNEGTVAPNAVTFVCVLQACANVGASALETGMQLHSQVKEQRLESHVVVGGSLVNMYVNCGSLNDARVVFDGLLEKNVVTWTAMITGYAQQEGMGQEALNLYSAMRNEGRMAPNAVTFACVLQACANVGVSALEKGKQLHSELKDQRFESDVVVGASLVNMYVKCGSLKDARLFFDTIGEKSVVTWSAMIAGYAQQVGMGQEALSIYSAMRNEGLVSPDAVTYVSLLEACTNVGALQQGKQLHSEIRKRGLETDALIGTCLVKMYAKGGCLEVSREVFDRLPFKDLLTWTALLKGYAEHGEGGLAIQCFEDLLEYGIEPDEVTYACLFTACSRAGMVDQGQQYFDTMLQRHGVQPNDQLLCCMVDLFGRSGHLAKAEQMLLASGLAGNAVSWTVLLSACKSHGDAETGKRCFDHLVKLEPTVATPYVLLGSIYASAGRWDEVDRVESLRRAAGARKTPAKACIEVKKEVHEFTVGEERSDVFATLKKMNKRVKEGGHVPHTQLVLITASEQEKEDALCGHAEKVALAFGLLNTPAGSTLVVTKNLKMCNDCHSSTKIMSRLEKREIVVRDAHMVHRFQLGACSCQDRP